MVTGDQSHLHFDKPVWHWDGSISVHFDRFILPWRSDLSRNRDRRKLLESRKASRQCYSPS